MTEKKGITSYVNKWHSLTGVSHNQTKTDSAKEAIQRDSQQGHGNDKSSSELLRRLCPVLLKLVWDIITYPYSRTKQRINRLRLSGRAFKKARAEGVEKGLFFQSSAGRNRYLIGNKKLFNAVNFPLPYTDEHSFFTRLTAYHLNKGPQIQSIDIEVKLNNGSLSDLVVTARSGTLQAYEVTLNTSNLLSNLEKYHNSSFIAVVFVTRNYQLSQAVKATIRESGIDPDLVAKARFIHIGKLIQRQQNLIKN